MLVRLTYFSRALRAMSLADIRDILQTARRNNAERGVCGMLSYASDWFLQALEGPREVVNDLFLEIADDPRHQDVIIVSYDVIAEPLFADWQMGYVSDAGEVARLLTELGLQQFDPPAMSPSQALAFLRALVELEHSAAA